MSLLREFKSARDCEHIFRRRLPTLVYGGLESFLFSLQFRPLAVPELLRGFAVQLVVVRLVYALVRDGQLSLKPPLALGSLGAYSLLVLGQGIHQLGNDFLGKLDVSEDFTEDRRKIVLPETRRRALALEAGTAIINMLLFDTLSGHRATAVPAIRNASERDVHGPILRPVIVGEYRLHCVEELSADDRLVVAVISNISPPEEANVRSVSEYVM